MVPLLRMRVEAGVTLTLLINNYYNLSRLGTYSDFIKIIL